MHKPSDGIEFSHNAFKAIAESIAALDKSAWTEADTRLKTINSVLFDVLGWNKDEANTEEHTGSGYIDYALRTKNTTRLIIEAKKDDISFDLNNRESANAYKLNGVVFNKAAKEAINQAIGYSAFKGCELACVTNGTEWIIFRANRLGDGQDTLEGKGFIFRSLNDIDTHFKIFYDLMSRQSAETLRYRGEFQRVEGTPVRDLSFLKPVRLAASKKLLQRGHFAADFDAIMASFFERLKGDQDAEMINKCFVITPESELADEKLMRISEDLVEKMRHLDTDTGQALIELIEAAKLQHKNRFILLVGNKGAGKSTFIDRFFKFVLPKDTAAGLTILRVDLSLNSGDTDNIVQWLNKRMIEEGEKTVFSSGDIEWDDIVGKMFFGDYQRWTNATMKHLYATDKNTFKIEFGRHIERIREEEPYEYVKRLLHYIIKSNQKIPCLIFDNTDHFTIKFQEAVFQYARSLYESEFCIVIVPITDKTSWQLSKQGALQSFESEVLSLPVPQPERVIEKRISFLFEKLEDNNDERRKEYFLSRGIRLKIKDIADFASNLNRVFIESKETSRWIGGLANHDIRRLLELTKDIIASPHLKLEDLLKAHIVGATDAVPEHKIKQAIIKRRYDIYPVGEHSFVQNVFALNMDFSTTPLLGVRILQFIRDTTYIPETQESEFVTVNALYDYFAAMGIHSTVIEPWLVVLLRSGLILNYDPTIVELNKLSRVELSPSGRIHLAWSTFDTEYMTIMKDVTPLRDREVYDQIIDSYKDYKNRWRYAIAVFIKYLLSEDAAWCKIPEHVNFSGQSSLTKRLERLLRNLDASQQADAA